MKKIIVLYLLLICFTQCSKTDPLPGTAETVTNDSCLSFLPAGAFGLPGSGSNTGLAPGERFGDTVGTYIISARPYDSQAADRR